MRKIISIEKSKCNLIWKSLLDIANRLNFIDRLEVYPNKEIYGLKGVMKELIGVFIQESNQAAIELEIETSQEELKCIQYLKSLVV